MRRLLRSRTAAALPLVLWAVFVLTTVVVMVVGLIDFDLELESTASKRSDARRIALTGLAYGVHPQVKRGDPLLFQKMPEGQLEVLIQSEDSRININQLLAGNDVKPLADLFRFWGLDERAATTAADSLKDWVDQDEFRSLNGAESADLPADEASSRPENRPFLAVSEMEHVRGMDQVVRAKPDWADSFSVQSSNQLDLQDVSPDLLEVFGGLSHEQALAFVKFRDGPDGKPATMDDITFENVGDIAVVIPITEVQKRALEARFSAGGSLKRIVSRGICGDRTYQIMVVARAGNVGVNEQFLEWSEK